MSYNHILCYNIYQKSINRLLQKLDLPLEKLDINEGSESWFLREYDIIHFGSNPDSEYIKKLWYDNEKRKNYIKSMNFNID